MDKKKITACVLAAALTASQASVLVFADTSSSVSDTNTSTEQTENTATQTETTCTDYTTIREDVAEIMANADLSTEEGILAAGYVACDYQSADEIQSGDIMVKTLASGLKITYVYIANGKCYQLGGSNPIMNFSFTEGSEFYHYPMQSSVVTAPTGLSGNYTDLLSTVSLPNGFSWQNDMDVLASMGENTFLADYTPDNVIQYTCVKNIPVTVTVGKKTATVGAPDDFSLTWHEGVSLSEYELPDGWSYVNPDQQLTMGTQNVSVVYSPSDTDFYEYDEASLTKTIQVNVLKATPEYSVPDTITVESGSTLSDSDLPQTTAGIFRWNSLETVSSTGVYYCTYIPADTIHYNRVYNIPIIVEVTKKSTEKTTTTQKESTSSSTKETTKSSSKSETETKKSSSSVTLPDETENVSSKKNTSSKTETTESTKTTKASSKDTTTTTEEAKTTTTSEEASEDATETTASTKKTSRTVRTISTYNVSSVTDSAVKTITASDVKVTNKPTTTSTTASTTTSTTTASGSTSSTTTAAGTTAVGETTVAETTMVDGTTTLAVDDESTAGDTLEQTTAEVGETVNPSETSLEDDTADSTEETSVETEEASHFSWIKALIAVVVAGGIGGLIVFLKKKKKIH